VLPAGESVTFPFRVNQDASFSMTWGWQDSPAEQTWHGGMVPAGPLVQRHKITITAHGVLSQVEPIPVSP
jgi:hypothetical protein